MDTFDIVVAGGGMVGASLAVALAPLGLSVAVVESFPPESEQQPSYDDRSTAVAFGSRQIFATMGVWPAIAAGATPIRRIQVSDRGRFGRTTINCAELDVEALGFVVENRILGGVLWRELDRCESITLISPATVKTLHAGGKSVQLALDQSGAARTIAGRLLVVADGARSRLRARLGIDACVEAYDQAAVIANVSTQNLHNHVAYERFTRTGPLAFLPLSGGRCSVVWSLSPDDAAHAMSMGDDTFLRELAAAFGYRLGRLQRVGRRASYPLSLVRAATVTAERSVVIGNAANGLHPVAGQGFNLGLRDVAVLADVLADARAGNSDPTDPGHADVLRAYQSRRTRDQAQTVSMTDGLVRVFSNPFAPLATLRGLGLIAVDLTGPARRSLARRMMGLDGRAPRLARGIPLK